MTKRHVPVTMADLEEAFENTSDAVRYYLDLETGAVAAIVDEIHGELEAIYAQFDEEQGLDDDAFAAALQQRNLPEWMREAVKDAHRVEQGDGERYLAFPMADSRESYGDMEDFIETIGNQRLRSQLAYAIQGRGAFRRFKDTLLAHPGERERWFAFRAARVRERALDWLAAEGIEVVIDREREEGG